MARPLKGFVDGTIGRILGGVSRTGADTGGARRVSVSSKVILSNSKSSIIKSLELPSILN